MNNSIVRSILATIAGFVVAVIAIFITESIGHIIYPPPEGLDLSKPEDQARLMELIPTGAKIAVVIAWFIGSLAGAIVAMRVARQALPGWIVAFVMIAMGVATNLMFPHPAWMMAAAVLLPILAVWLAQRWTAKYFPS